MFNTRTMKLTVKSHLRESFFRIKPLCDSVMTKPTPEHIAEFMAMVPTVKQESLQELQQYILFPFITHIKSAENERKYDLLIQIIDAMTMVLERIKMTTFEVALKAEIGLLSLVFDRAKLGMIANVPEELKLSVMKCLTALMLGATNEVKIQMLKTQVPILAQAVFVSVHVAKLEKLRPLRMVSLECLSAHTMCHRSFLDSKLYLKSPALDEPTADFLSSILPGVLAALQDVAMSKDNPGHALVVAALDTTHRVLCLTMHNKRMKKKPDVTLQDFTNMIARSYNELEETDSEPSQTAKSTARAPAAARPASAVPKLAARCGAWYLAAGEKLLLVTRSLAPLAAHEHVLVRRELAVFAGRIVRECCDTMPSSVPLALDILITLSKDEYEQVSEYCDKVIKSAFSKPHRRELLMNGMCENFFVALHNVPRTLNNIDSSRKLVTLNLLRGYIDVLCGQARPQRLTVALSAADRCDMVCDTLVAAAALQHELTMLTRQNGREMTISPVSHCPWLQLRHLDSSECQEALESIIQLLGAAECSELLLDRLLELFHERRDCELVYIMNWMGSAPKAPTSLAKRIINAYIEEDIWYLPLDISTNEQPLTKEETLDPSVYNPRAWAKDSVPGLYEGATEVRYTDISYQYARVRAQPAADTCRTVAQSQRHLALSCLLTEGLGRLAKRLGAEYQPFLLKTLCLVLERVGSKYEVLHKSGALALQQIAEACGLSGAAELVAHNADYFTSQISLRLKKAWDVQSALQILTVVMTYSDTTILEYLYAIVEDVLVQSCDKYHRKDLFAYLQVFECFVYCIHQWFPKSKPCEDQASKDYLKDFTEYVENTEKVEKLLNCEEFEKETGKSAEEMYREDIKRREEDVLDYDDTVTKEKPPLPKHVSVTVTILKRTINFIATRERDEGILAMHILLLGFPILRDYQDELLPLIHQSWAPFVGRLVPTEPLVMRKAFELLVVMADVSKDFIRSRAVKEALPPIFKFLSLSSGDSFLKDTGAAYRLAPAYSLQVTVLTQLPFLAQEVALSGTPLHAAFKVVAQYLKDKQPKQLQLLAVQFYKLMLRYDYGATWLFLRELCNNDDVIEPPAARYVHLQHLVGTPYRATDKEIDANIQHIFDFHIRQY